MKQGLISRRELAERIRRYDFYAAVHALLMQGEQLGGKLRMIPRRGGYFPGTDLDSLVKGMPYRDEFLVSDEDDRKLSETVSLVINCFGLHGPASILPFYFNYLITSEATTGSSLGALLEVLNDRLYQNLYRVWAIPRRFDRDKEGIEKDQRNILACCGLSGDLLRIPRKLVRVAYLAQPSRSPWGLKRMAEEVLGVPVGIAERIPFRVRLGSGACSRLGRHSQQLGGDFFLGKWITDISMHFRVTLGPMPIEDFQSFMPQGKKNKELFGILGLYTPFHLKYDIHWKLRKEDFPRLKWRLGTPVSRLGMGTVLKPDVRGNDLTVRYYPADRSVRRIPNIRLRMKDWKRGRTGFRDEYLRKLEMSA